MKEKNRLNRALTPKNLYDQKFEIYHFTGIFKEVFGKVSKGGIWLLYGKDKNGKSTTSLVLSNVMRKMERVLYISAEEGKDIAFVEAMKRADIPASAKNFKVIEYEPLEDLYKRFKSQRPPQFVVLDNATMYSSEIRKREMMKLTIDFPEITFLIVAHEERNQPYTTAAVMAQKLAKIILRVQGNAVFVSGRCPGGHLAINHEKAMLFHGSDI